MCNGLLSRFVETSTQNILQVFIKILIVHFMNVFCCLHRLVLCSTVSVLSVVLIHVVFLQLLSGFFYKYSRIATICNPLHSC